MVPWAYQKKTGWLHACPALKPTPFKMVMYIYVTSNAHINCILSTLIHVYSCNVNFRSVDIAFASMITDHWMVLPHDVHVQACQCHIFYLYNCPVITCIMIFNQLTFFKYFFS